MSSSSSSATVVHDHPSATGCVWPTGRSARRRCGLHLVARELGGARRAVEARLVGASPAGSAPSAPPAAVTAAARWPSTAPAARARRARRAPRRGTAAPHSHRRLRQRSSAALAAGLGRRRHRRRRRGGGRGGGAAAPRLARTAPTAAAESAPLSPPSRAAAGTRSSARPRGRHHLAGSGVTPSAASTTFTALLRYASFDSVLDLRRLQLVLAEEAVGGWSPCHLGDDVVEKRNGGSAAARR